MEPLEKPKKDWKISELYKQSWQIIKNNKVLWLFGMAAASLFSNYNFRGSSTSNNSSSGPINNLQSAYTNLSKTYSPSEIYQLTGASTNPFVLTLQQIAHAVPITTYILLAVGILLLVLMGAVLRIAYSSWATGALISGIQTALSNQKAVIAGSSTQALPKIKPLVWLKIVPNLAFGLFSGLLLFLLFLGILSKAATAFFGILFFIAVIAVIVGFSFLLFAQIWAQRRVIIDNKSGQEAIFSGIKIAKKKFWPMAGLTIVNGILSFAVMFIPILLIGIVAVTGYLNLTHNHALAINLFVIAGIVFLLFILSFVIVNGILNAFFNTVWTIAYNKIRSQFGDQ